MPFNPVPIVSALVAVAVTVTEPPKLTELPLIVIALFVNELLPMLDSVFVDPLIDTPANVVSVPPNDKLEEPMVTELLVNPLLGIVVLIALAGILIAVLLAKVS